MLRIVSRRGTPKTKKPIKGVTHVSTVSEQLGINAKGYNPSHDFDEQIRLMYLFSSEMKQPVYYRLINKNITDISSMSLCVREMNVNKRCCFYCR